MELYENGNTMISQGYNCTLKAVLEEKFIDLTAYIKISEESQINNLMMQLKYLEKWEQIKPEPI